MKNHYNCIYLYINKINGHKYVGQAKDFIKRHKEHINESKNENRKEYNYPFNKAIRKYGIENFEIKILAENIKDKERISEYEIFFIKRYKSLKTQNGYNIAKGGYENPFEGKTEEEIKEINKRRSESMKGKNSGDNNAKYWLNKKMSEESRKKMSEAKKEIYIGENNPFYGKHHTEESKQKQRDKMRGRKLTDEHKQKLGHKGSKNPKSKRIAQYDLDGNLIKVWDYIQEASEHFRINRNTLRTYLKGKNNNKYKEYIWKYYEED